MGIAIDSVGNIYTANANGYSITKITPSGTSSVFGTTGNGPVGIVTDSDDNLYVTNSNDDTVTKITPSGTSSIFGTTGDKPFGIAIDSAGSIYTTNRTGDNVSKITPEPEESSSSSSSSSKKHKSSSIRFTCKDKKASNYDRFGRHKQSKCKYDQKEVTNTVVNPVVNTNTQTTTKCNFTYTQMLQEKSQGQAVKKLQNTLNKLGYKAGKADGIFGKRTKQAVMNFQTVKGLKADGVVGSKTGMKLSVACRM
ncbi:hypothetical protein CSB11_03110 [Candidatus Campbellbacteria bacterium]|nr:MAG: hypothetical protein CSB11_03110 [Candidatus Campbellbacteria bacterium]